MKRILLVIALVLALSLAGCQVKQAASNTTKPPATTQITTPSTPQNTAEAPAQLNSIESNSEDIMDDIAKNDWTAAQNKVNEIKTNFNTLKPMLESTQISIDTINGMGKVVTALETAVKEKQSYEARLQANQITSYVPDVYDKYKVTIPTDVSRLDYLGREINLNVEKSDWTTASSNYDTANKLWNQLKPSLSTSYQKDIDTFQNNMDSLKSEIDQKNANGTIKQANALLENVDMLETDFTNQNKP
jgi:multidrug efflux pump subunit AcrA (membrane-fusion protein)